MVTQIMKKFTRIAFFVGALMLVFFGGVGSKTLADNFWEGHDYNMSTQANLGKIRANYDKKAQALVKANDNLTKAKDELQAQKDANGQLQDQLNSIKQQEIDEQNSFKDQLAQKEQEIQDKIAEGNQKVTDKQAELDQLQKRYDDLNQQVINLKNQVKDLQNQLEASKEDNAHLSQALQEAKDTNDKTSDLVNHTNN